jgi:hypothetical protein
MSLREFAEYPVLPPLTARFGVGEVGGAGGG